ncbi:MAG: GNAT family N-acetyltransferase [Halobacteriovoraceae bacterium]|nr:GNAT family N-acetyltransferase [Halobacteriovoraceae bacterium]MBT5096141.1 GNAT family N-acetyltransferase [Halobacteriovoraceae bacterium]
MAENSIEIKAVDCIRDERVRSILQKIDAYQREVYPDDSNGISSDDVLTLDNLTLYGAFEGDHLYGLGAIIYHQDYGEMKRLYVDKRARGKGVANLLLKKREEIMRQHGYKIARLETGIHQAAAIKLFKKRGFIEVKRFGSYNDDPLSVFMEKDLTQTIH